MCVVGAVCVFLSTCSVAVCDLLPVSLSLPAHISIDPPWHSLTLTHTQLPLISNSSPAALTHTLLLMPHNNAGSTATLRASYGHSSATQLLSDPLLDSCLSAFLMSSTVYKQHNTFMVRVLFQWRGDTAGGKCVTLHVFYATEHQRASCVTQAPLGVCTVSLSLPESWFHTDVGNSSEKHTHTVGLPHRHRGRRYGVSRGNSRGGSKLQLYFSSCGSGSLQSSLTHLGGVAVKGVAYGGVAQSGECVPRLGEVELQLDSDVLIGYSRGPHLAERAVPVSLLVTRDLSQELLVVRLQVKKGLLSVTTRPSVTSDLCTVTLEKHSGTTHDTFSLTCGRIGNPRDSAESPHKLVCLYVELLRSFGRVVTVTIHWGSDPHGSDGRAAVSNFLFTHRELVGVAPVIQSRTLINTAVLSGQPVVLPVTVLALDSHGELIDVTATVTCSSADEDVLKVSTDCSALFVDGSECGSGTHARLQFSLGSLSANLTISVWAPVLPLLISLSDPELNRIQGWSQQVGDSCVPVFQRSSVQVLALFAAKSPGKGRSYLLGTPDCLVDVTALVGDWLAVENPQVARLGEGNNLIGLQPGVTSLQVTSSRRDAVLGRCNVTVSGDAVLVGDLSVQVIADLNLSVRPSSAHPSVVMATVTAHNTLRSGGQEALLSIWLQFSDDSSAPITAFSSTPHTVTLSSLASTVVAVTSTQRVFAQGDGGGPLLRAELLVSTCQSASVPHRVSRGSGWVRVNLGQEDSGTGEYETSETSNMSLRDGLQAALTPKGQRWGVFVQGDTRDMRQVNVKGQVGVGAVLSLIFTALLLLTVSVSCALKDRWRRNQPHHTQTSR